MESKFFKDEQTGFIYTSLSERAKMEKTNFSTFVPNQSGAAIEKHVPVVQINGDKVTVKVGEVLHPMEENHYIVWICLETEHSQFIHYFYPGEEPIFCFQTSEAVKAAYAYCNTHELWQCKL